MRRRKFVTAVGGLGIGGLAGCSALGTGNEEEKHDPTPRETQTPQPWDIEDLRRRPPHFTVIDILELTDETLKVEAYFEATAPLHITVHETHPSADNPRDWTFMPPLTPFLYDSYNGYKWNDEKGHFYSEEERQTWRMMPWLWEPGEQVASKDTPGIGAPTDHRVDVAQEHFEFRQRNNGMTGGAILEFDLEKSPPVEDEFVYSFVIHDVGPDGYEEGNEHLAWNTPQIIKYQNGKVVHAKLHNGNGLAEGERWKHLGGLRRTFALSGFNNGKQKDVVKNVARRATTWSRLSNMMQEIQERQREAEDNEFAGDWRPMDTGNRKTTKHQNLWTLQWQVDADTVLDSRKTVANEVTGDPWTDMRVLAGTDAVINHPKVQEVASMLYDQCEAMDMKYPIDRVRVIADFIQNFNYQLSSSPSPHGYIDSPVGFLATKQGDCKEFTLTAYSILAQDQFDVTPKLAFFHRVPSNRMRGEVGHVALGIPWSDLEIDDHSNDPMPGAMMNEKNAGDSEHVYIETTSSISLGMVPNSWPSTPDFKGPQ